jgi:hypothetical protein
MAHAVWEDPDGKLWDVTPYVHEVVGEQVTCVYQDIDFEPDATVAWEEDGRPPSGIRYVPKGDNKFLVRACKYMERGDDCLSRKDLEGCRYWTDRANEQLRRGRLPLCWDTPATADVADIFRAGLFRARPAGQ